jgi:hypothetical protein
MKVHNLWLICCLLPAGLSAQTTERPVETRVVEVVHNFEGNIMDTDRLPLPLTVSDSLAVFQSSFLYKPEPTALPVFSLTQNIPAAAIEEKRVALWPNGYARVGTGFPLSPFADFYFHKVTNRVLLNLYYNHRSYWANVPLADAPSAAPELPNAIAGHTMHNDAGASIQYRTKDVVLHLDIDYRHRALLFHGHDTAALRNATPEYIRSIRDHSSDLRKALGQTYHFFSAKAGVASNHSPEQFSYAVDVHFDYTHGTFAATSEYIGGISGKLSQPFQTVHSADVAFSAMAYNKGEATQWSDGLFRVTPAYVYQKNNLKIVAGVNIEGVYTSYPDRPARDSGRLAMGLYPNISATRKFSDYLTVYAAIEGATRQNTYRQAVLENPYLLPGVTLDNTRTPYEITLGLSGRLFHLIGYHLFGRFSAIDSLYFYVNSAQPLLASDPVGALGHNFEVRYSPTHRSSIGLDVDYTTNDWEAILRGRYHAYSFSSATEQAWHRPAWELTGDVRYRYEKYSFQAGFAARGALPVYYQTPLSGEVVTEIKARFDLSLQAEYRLNKWMTAFVYGHNLLNQKYQNYYLYYAPGITAGAGVTFAW